VLQARAQLIAQYGQGVTSDVANLRSLLRDLVPADTAAIDAVLAETERGPALVDGGEGHGEGGGGKVVVVPPEEVSGEDRSRPGVLRRHRLPIVVALVMLLAIGVVVAVPALRASLRRRDLHQKIVAGFPIVGKINCSVEYEPDSDTSTDAAFSECFDLPDTARLKWMNFHYSVGTAKARDDYVSWASFVDQSDSETAPTTTFSVDGETSGTWAEGAVDDDVYCGTGYYEGTRYWFEMCAETAADLKHGMTDPATHLLPKSKVPTG
jgi:hypothetical protein